MGGREARALYFFYRLYPLYLLGLGRVSENKYNFFYLLVWWYEKKALIFVSTNNKTTTYCYE